MLITIWAQRVNSIGLSLSQLLPSNFYKLTEQLTLCFDNKFLKLKTVSKQKYPVAYWNN